MNDPAQRTANVFISHHNSDIDFARLVAEKLKAHQVPSWLSEDNLVVGQSWADKIDSALRDSIAVVVIMTPDTRSSEYVTYEWSFAMGMSKPIIPILHEAGPQHPKLQGLQYLDFQRGQPLPWESLIDTIQAIPSTSPRDPGLMDWHDEEIRRVREEALSSPPPVKPAKLGASAGSRDVFVIVDVQNDFFENGPLTAANVSTLLGPLNKAIATASGLGMRIVLTRDWHPDNHSSFNTQGGVWPPHCRQNTPGAQFHESLILPKDAEIVNIGERAEQPGYTPYEDARMDVMINQRDVGTVYVAGIALEYCVQATCLDTKLRRKRVVLCDKLVRAATADPVRIEKIHQDLIQRGIEIISNPLPFEQGHETRAAAAGATSGWPTEPQGGSRV